MEPAELLGVPPDAVDDVLDHFQEWTFREQTYRVLRKSYRGIEHGTVLIGDTAIRGFPSIPRVLVLEEGLSSFFRGPIVVEEKLNGYNVRIARIGGEILAFTRGGYVCPFTTAKVRDQLRLGTVFDERPECTICGEMIGPENPYVAYDYPDVREVEFRAFDVRDRVSGAPLPVAERRRLCSTHRVPQTPSFGRYASDEPSRLSALVDNLDRRGREGIVMKSLDGRNQLKYTTSVITRNDLALGFSQPYDSGRDYLFSRVTREAFRAYEYAESRADLETRASELGASLLLPMVDTIGAIDCGDIAGERHTIRGSPDLVDETLDHLAHLNIHVRIDEDATADGERVVTFTKRAKSTTDKIGHYLSGGTVTE